MTLRLRLVLALAALVTAGLAVFGVTTYQLYARSQYDRLDDLLRSSVPSVGAELRFSAGFGPGPSDDDEPGPGGPPIVLPPGTYGELRDSDDNVIEAIQLSSSVALPDLPNPLPPSRPPSFRTVGSASGSGRWRMLVTAAVGPGVTDDTLVV